MVARKALTGAYPAGNTYFIIYITVSSSYITVSSSYITVASSYITVSSSYITVSSSYITVSSSYITVSSNYITVSSILNYEVPISKLISAYRIQANILYVYNTYCDVTLSSYVHSIFIYKERCYYILQSFNILDINGRCDDNFGLTLAIFADIINIIHFIK